MGKHGPCCHCGVTSTPLWRNGPPEKPVLCNACGSRWRTKGTLTNYTPLHARAEPDDLVDYRAAKGKTISIKHREANFLKRKYDNHVTDYGMVPPQYNDGYRRAFDEDISNRSSSGSAISNSESCAQYGTAEASDLTGPTQPVIWDSTVPSRKRTCVTRPKPSPVEKLTKDLYTIWHEQSSCLSVSTEDDLLPVTEEPLGSVEFGHGSVLIRQPSSIAREEESEASSLPVDHKHRAVSSQRMIFPCVKEETGVNSSIREIKKPTSEGVDRARREEDQREKLQTLVLHSSPLCRIDLQEIVNFDQFTNLFTNDEKKNLLKFLPAVDIVDPFLRADEKHSLQKFLPAVETAETSLRLKSLFDSPQFKENLLSFQKVLGDGVLDGSLSGITKDECKMLKKLLLCIPLKSKWVEQYQNFKESKVKTGVDESEVVREFNSIPTNYSATKKRSQDGQPQKLAGAKVGMKNPKRILMKPNYEQKELLDNDENLLSAKRALSSHTNNGSLVLNSSHLMEDSSEQDLLIELPSHSSFPQAELLLPIPTTSFGAQASSSSSVYTNAMRR